MGTPQSEGPEPRVSVIIPARNEEASLGACLQSLTQQSGVAFEIMVVDDGSTDRTRAIARSFPGVRVIDAPPLSEGWTGKNNAAAAGARQARGEWFLFTDADTVHKPGSLARAVSEAEQHGASLLSYSPEQEVHGFWEKAVMPVIFADLADVYPPAKVSDPACPIAAANGQYLLVSREAYEAVGGHAAVANSLLEDVAIARLVKRSGRRIFFRFGGDAVRTRMYRSFSQLREGWTKNLALLFPHGGWLAGLRLSEFVLVLAGGALTLAALWNNAARLAIVAGAATAILCALVLHRIRKAHFSRDTTLLALLGLPVFSYLWLLSRLSYGKGTVTWKDRHYKPSEVVVEVKGRAEGARDFGSAERISRARGL